MCCCVCCVRLFRVVALCCFVLCCFGLVCCGLCLFVIVFVCGLGLLCCCCCVVLVVCYGVVWFGLLCYDKLSLVCVCLWCVVA